MLTTEEELGLFNQRRLMEEASIGIEDLMARQGVSRADLARRIGRSRAFVTRILSGSHNFTFSTFADVSRALGRRPVLHWGDDFETVIAPIDDIPVSEAVSGATTSFQVMELPSPTDRFVHRFDPSQVLTLSGISNAAHPNYATAA